MTQCSTKLYSSRLSDAGTGPEKMPLRGGEPAIWEGDPNPERGHLKPATGTKAHLDLNVGVKPQIREISDM